MLILKRDETPGKPAAFDAEGNLAAPAEIGCALPEVINDIRKGEEIWFDDGKIGGIIEAVETRGAMVRICLGRERIRLREDKGINLPMTDLRLPSLTEKDRQDLPFIVGNADIVALSFARTAKDIELLKDAIDKIDGKSPAIIIKVETRLGFENLPAMLLSAMIAPCCGVMIARGDLAVECGFERMAEVQEEILWLCEAAHVPVIWATQVLESMARDGLPSRAEITDAAMGNRAECVMLNKGPFIIRAVEALSNILKRMQGHQSKKQAMLRELKLANTLLGI
jgi:pyruvate kinase